MKPIDFSNLSLADKQAILNGPALTPPPGVVPNFDHPANANELGVITHVVCMVTTGIVFCLRAYAKIFCAKKLHIEDYLGAVALGLYFSIIYCSIQIIKINGLFVHQWDIRLKDIISSTYVLHVASNLCAVEITILKASILVEWIRIFVPPGTRNSFFWVAVAMLIFHTLFHAAWIVTENLSCRPYRRIWDVTVPGGKCTVGKILHIPSSAMNLTTNIIILILPQKAIWSLQMSKKNKIGVSLVFTLGFLASVSATFRLYKTFLFYRSEDGTYTVSGLWLWALAELTCLHLVFCVPAIPKAFVGREFKSKIKTLLTWKSKTSSNGSQLRLRPLYVNRPRSDGAYRPRKGSTSNDLNTPSTEAIRGPVIEITADAHEDDSLREVSGILCTTQFKAEVITSDRGDSQVNNGEGKGYEKYPWSVMH